ncbi:phage tail tape measure protein [Sporosarcina highlanderae]|uniref:Phage tail tape measure protein n=1 Tax=Sporosarcina highlanderae TaxID=3035916 RepID=A0ABT8JYA3_9BACL|nr:phage tail tape measure protein [Sporosarcina highlanderae]MDN4609119.1 phage tail tape measure protein [Sporosarcina highlanderae]
MSSKDIGTLRTRLSWEDEGADRSLKGFRDDLKSLRTEMGVAKSSGKEYSQSLKGLREQSDILTRTLKTQKEQVAELRKRYEESKRVKGEDSDQTRKLSDDYNRAVAAMNRTEQQLGKVNAAIEEQVNPLKRLGKEWQETGDKMQSIGRSMTDFGKEYSMKVTAPIMGIGAAAFKAAVDYESAFAGVRKTVDMQEEEFQQLSRAIRDMSKEIPAAATEIARVAEAAGQLGIKNEAIQGFTRTMIDLGVATNMSSDEAATALARFANITQMSQKDFGRLGSVVVNLGNNFATTEREIVDMALRLAGAGAQVGMSEADILALSTALSSVGIQAEMGGSAISRVMVNMQVASTGTEKFRMVSEATGMTLRELQLAAGSGGKAFGMFAESLGMTKKELNSVIKTQSDLENFAKIAGMTGEQFKKAFQEDAIGAIGAFINGLGNAEEAGTTAIEMLQEMGITEIRLRDSLLRAGGAAELFANAVDLSSNAWDENIALTKEAEERYKTTESQLKMLWNRVKDVGITLGDALIPALLATIDAAMPLIKQIESGAKAFADMDESQQQTILKLIALVAAVGPASVALGGLTTTVGGVASIGGKLMSTLGGAGGAGLLGRIGLMGPAAATPVGLAIAGVGLLAYGIYEFNKASDDSAQKALQFVESRKKELDSMDELIASFELLKLKNKLSTDEMLRYLDISDEIKKAKTEEAILALTEEQEKLREKSGLTNEEMERFLEMNEKLVEKAPSTAKAISEQGNAYAAVTGELKKLNAEERQRLVDKTYRALTDEMNKQEKILEKQRKINEEIIEREESRSKQLKFISDDTDRIREINLNIADLKERAKTATGAELKELEKKIKSEERSKSAIESSVGLSEKLVDTITKQIDTKKESLAETNKELEAFGLLIDEYEQMILYQAGITSERGKGVEKLQEEQRNIDESRKKLEEMRKSGALVGGEYDEQNRKLDEQQTKIDQARRKLEEMNVVAGKTVYKDVNVKTNPSIASLNSQLSDPVWKTVNINTGPVPIGYSVGTPLGGHDGGPFIAGEEGWELGRMGNRWEMLNFGLYNRPAGYEVFTHDESKQILNAMNKIPGYADGARSNGEAERTIGRLNQPPTMIHIKPAPVILDGRVIGEVVFDTVDTMQYDRQSINATIRGVSL